MTRSIGHSVRAGLCAAALGLAGCGGSASQGQGTAPDLAAQPSADASEVKSDAPGDADMADQGVDPKAEDVAADLPPPPPPNRSESGAVPPKHKAKGAVDAITMDE